MNTIKSETRSRALEWTETLPNGKRITDPAVADRLVAELGDGWRMPTVHELLSIVDRTRYDPAIDTHRFPDTRSDLYWTSTPCAWNKSARWVVDFDGGGVRGYGGGSNACVRACRPSQ